MNITLLIPALIPPRNAATLWQELAVPCLKQVLARGAWTHNIAPDAHAWLTRTFGVEALAPVMAAADGFDASEGYWLNATPVHVEARRTTLVLSNPAALQLAPGEAAALAATLREHLAASAWVLHAPHPARWYIRSETPLLMSGTAPQYAIGRSIESFHAGREAHRLLTEIQMLLHDHPVNQARVAAGRLPVNHLWVWDGGRLTHPGADTKVAPYTRVHSADYAVRALSAHAGITCHDLVPAPLEVHALAGKSHLLTSELPDTALTNAGPTAWTEVVTRLEQDWFRPLLRARPAAFTLITGGAGPLQQFILRAGDLRRFFRHNDYLGHA